MQFRTANQPLPTLLFLLLLLLVPVINAIQLFGDLSSNVGTTTLAPIDVTEAGDLIVEDMTHVIARMTQDLDEIPKDLVMAILCDGLPVRRGDCSAVPSLRQYIARFAQTTNGQILTRLGRRKKRFAQQQNPWDWSSGWKQTNTKWDPAWDWDPKTGGSWNQNNYPWTQSGFNKPGDPYQNPYGSNPTGWNKPNDPYSRDPYSNDPYQKNPHPDPYSKNNHPWQQDPYGNPFQNDPYKKTTRNPYHNPDPWKGSNQKIVNAICPTQSNQTLLYNYNTDLSQYPAAAIGADFVTLPIADQACFLLGVVPPGGPPAIVEQDFFDNATETCPSVSQEIGMYDSQFAGTRCWIVRNFQEIVNNTACTTRYCQGCPANSYQQDWHGGSRANLCYSEFRTVSVVAWCPDLAPPPARFIRDRIIVSVACKCYGVRCDVHTPYVG